MKDNTKKNTKLIIAVTAVVIVLAVALGFPAFLKAKQAGKINGLNLFFHDVPVPEKSSTYFVGFDYSSYDLFGMAPVVICKVRYDKKIEATFKIEDENGVLQDTVMLYDLTDEQYSRICNGIDLFTLYNLDPELPDPESIMDGGDCWLFMYGESDEVLKRIGGFCPMSEKFHEYRRVIFDNLPEDFEEFYAEYEKPFFE